MSSVPRHSEEELRQQWAFLDALVDKQATSLKSGVQDPEEDDLSAAGATDGLYMEEISTLTRRVTSLEGERKTLLRRIDLSEQARMAAENGRATAEAARAVAERALAEQRVGAGLPSSPSPVTSAASAPPETPAVDTKPVAAAPAVAQPAATQPVTAKPPTPSPRPAPVPLKVAPSKRRRRTWWQRFKE